MNWIDRNRAAVVMAGRTALLVVCLWTPVTVACAEPPVSQSSDGDRAAKLAERDRVWKEANQLRAEGKLEAALARFAAVIELQRTIFGAKSEGELQALEKIAELHRDRANWADARAAVSQALEICETANGKDAWRTTDLRLLASDIERWAKLNERQRVQLSSADRLLSDAIRLSGQGKYREAVPLVDQSLTLRRQVLGDTHHLVAVTWMWLGFLHNELRDAKRAEAADRKALEIRKQTLGEMHPHYAMSLHNLATMYDNMGDYERAEPLYRQAANITEHALGPTHPLYATSLSCLATLYYNQGQYVRAEPLYKQALEIRRQALGETNSEYAQSMHNLAELYSVMGDYGRAEPLFKQALKIEQQVHGEMHPDYARSLNNLAILYFNQGDYAQAETLYRQALEIRKQALGEMHPDYAQSLNNLAQLYSAIDSYARAEPLLNQALEIRRQMLGEGHPDFALSLSNLALLYDTTGDYARAEPLYRQALEIRKHALGEMHPDYATSLNNLAILELATGRPGEAEQLLRRAVGIQRRELDLTAAVQSERQQLTMTSQRRWALDNYVSAALAAGIPPDELYTELAAWKGSVSAQQQLVRARQRALAADKDSELGRLFADLDTKSRRLAALYRYVPKPAEAASVQNTLRELIESVDDLQERLSQLDSEFHRNWAERHVSLDDLRRSIPSNTALVDLLEYDHYVPSTEKRKKPIWERRVVAFVVRGDQGVVCVPLGGSATIGALIAAWRDGYGALPASDGKPPGAELRRLLWQPLVSQLSGIESVLISPDGALAQLPWSALPGERSGTFLVEERAIAVIPIPQLLPELLRHETHVGPPDSLLLAGDIDYGDDPQRAPELPAPRAAASRPPVGQPLHFGRLAAAQSELSSIRDWYEQADANGSVQVLRRSKATEAAFRHEAPQYPWIHLITHGFFASTETAARSTQFSPEPVSFGLLSGLAFAGANAPPSTGNDDGILTALEVAALDLSRVDTVVLSACETGLGQAAAGEGLLSLQRSFQVAGAKTVVASLWKVPDAATSRLMQRFYENLWDKKMGKLAALREAQIWLLRDQGNRGLMLDAPTVDRGANDPPNGLSPFYWAAFVLSGDWR
ncbi:MAG TPA: tetratricopeptide repeat protein [Pirellulales bacterium]|nr:tetratricopeptide repeat protein [Pirellulales bacterium]